MPSQTLPEDIFDVRKRERFLQEGLLTQEQVDAYLSTLEDCSADVDTSNVQMISHTRSRTFLSADEGGPEEDEG